MKIMLCDPVDQVITDHFESQKEHEIFEEFDRPDQLDEIGDVNVIVVRSGTTVDQEMLDAAPDLDGIVRAGVGLDNIDLDYAEKKDVRVENTPEASTNAVAELVVGHILSIYREIPRADDALKEGDWIKSELDGREIQGKTVGVIGFGRIGARLSELLSAFGAEILGFDKFISDDEISNRGGNPVTLNQLLEESDIVTVHVPLTDETRHMISHDELDTLDDEAILINCSRGGVYDETALEESLINGNIYGVGLDTYEQEPPEDLSLIQQRHVTSTPHIGASTREAQERIGQLVIEKIESFQ